MDLLKALGLDSMQFLGRSCGFPSTLIINGAAYLYTYKSLAHPDAEEVTKGFIEGEVEAHNAKAKAKQAQ